MTRINIEIQLSWESALSVGSWLLCKQKTIIVSVTDNVIVHHWGHWYKMETAASDERNVSHDWSDSYTMLPSHPQGFCIKVKWEEAWITACLRIGLHLTSKVQERSKTKASNGRRKTNKQRTNIPPGSKIVEWDMLKEPGGLKLEHFWRLIEVIWKCVLGLRVWWTWSGW